MAFMENSNIMLAVFTMFLVLYEWNAAKFNEIETVKKQHVFKKKKWQHARIGEREYE